MSFPTDTAHGLRFNVLPIKADGSPGDFGGVTVTVVNGIPGIVEASIEPDGRLKVVPLSPGVATLVCNATLNGVPVNGTLNVVVSPARPPTTGIAFALSETFPVP